MGYPRASYLTAEQAEQLTPYAWPKDSIWTDLAKVLPEMIRAGKTRVQVLDYNTGNLHVTVYEDGKAPRSFWYRGDF